MCQIWALVEPKSGHLMFPNLGILEAFWAFCCAQMEILEIFGIMEAFLGISCAQIWAFWTVEGLGTWQEPLIRSWVGGGADLETS